MLTQFSMSIMPSMTAPHRLELGQSLSGSPDRLRHREAKGDGGFGVALRHHAPLWQGRRGARPYLTSFRIAAIAASWAT